MLTPMMNPMMNNKMMKADGDGPPDFGIGQPPTQPGMGGDPIPMEGGAPPTSGGFQLPDWITNQLGNFQGVMSNPLLFPSLAAAFQQFHQSRQYTDMAEQYAGQLDPFGSQRGFYQDRLRRSYEDPNSVLQDPAYQRQLDNELNQLEHRQASQGFLGSGNMMQAVADHVHASDEKHLQDYRQQLSPLTGAQFGPESAARMLQTGLLGRMGAENNAIGNLMVPFLNQSRNNTIVNNQGGPNGQNGGGRTATGAIGDQLARTIMQGGGRDIVNQAISNGIRFVKLPDGSTADLWGYARSGYQNGDDPGMFYPTNPDNPLEQWFGSGGGSGNPEDWSGWMDGDNFGLEDINFDLGGGSDWVSGFDL